MSSDLSTGKTVFIIVVVVGCFAVLWPKVFYPMLTSSGKAKGFASQWRDQSNIHHMTRLCFLLEEQQVKFDRWSEKDCFAEVRRACNVKLNERIVEGFRVSKDRTNLTECLAQKYGLSTHLVSSAAPPPTRVKAYKPTPPQEDEPQTSQSKSPHPHTRQERPTQVQSPDSLHPATRDKGRVMPQRTIEQNPRPGPLPGVRPTIGGGHHMGAPSTKGGSSTMGIIMPLYTVGIVVFFLYTLMKVLFKKTPTDSSTGPPQLKDFHLDPEYRKFVFAEEYLDSANATHREALRKQERDVTKLQKKAEVDTKLEDEQMDQLRRRLEETERAMEKLMSQMGSVTDKLTAAKITEVLSQAQAQAKILKEEVQNINDQESVSKDSTLSDEG